MKKLLLTSLLTFLAAFAFAQGKFAFTETVHDFGEIKEGVKAQHVFKFTNEGTAPIVITNVQASCGCTTPSWTKEPIAPGEVGEISAVYNSAGRPGQFYKSITITSNADEPVVRLNLKGVVQRQDVTP